MRSTRPAVWMNMQQLLQHIFYWSPLVPNMVSDRGDYWSIEEQGREEGGFVSTNLDSMYVYT
jgi:hypothetical protein